MAQKSPWHSTRSGETVYHNNSNCTEGNNIRNPPVGNSVK